MDANNAIKQIQSATRNDESYTSQSDSILAHMKNDADYLKIAFESILGILQVKNDELIERKFLTLTLLKDSLLAKNSKLINLVANNKILQEIWETIAIFDVGSQDDNRGRDLYKGNKKQDPEVCAQYFRLTLELISYLATTYPADAKKNPTKFKQLFDSLKQRNVKFPSTMTMMKPYNQTNGLSKSLHQQIQKPQENNHLSQTQVQKPLPLDRQTVIKTLSQNIYKQLDELQISINADVDMIYDTLKEGDGGMDYVNEVLETFSKSVAVDDKKLQKALNNALELDNILNQSQLEQVTHLKEFTEKFPALYKQFIQKGSTSQGFESMKQQLLRMASQILGKDDHLTNQNDQKNQFEESQRSQTSDRIAREQRDYEHKKQEQQKQSQILDQERRKQEQLKQQQQITLEQQREQEKIYERDRQRQREREMQIEKDAIVAKKLKESNQVQDLTGASMKQSQKGSVQLQDLTETQLKQSQYHRTSNHDSLHTRESQDMIRFEQLQSQSPMKTSSYSPSKFYKDNQEDKPLESEQSKYSYDMRQMSQNNSPSLKPYQISSHSNNKGNSQNMIQSVFSPSRVDVNNQRDYDHYMDEKDRNKQSHGRLIGEMSFSNRANQHDTEAYLNQNQMRYFYVGDTSRAGSFGGRNQKDTHLNLQENQYLYQHDERFDTLSSTSNSELRDLNLFRDIRQLPPKEHFGRLCHYDSSQFQVFQSQNLNEVQIRRWKIVCLSGKGALIERPEIQIGVTQQLVYNTHAQKMFLKMSIFFGNKSNQPLRNMVLEYEGDQTSHILVKPETLPNNLLQGQQLKQEVITQITQPKFRLINGVLDYTTTNETKCKLHFFLPFTLVSFMDFKDIDSRLFRPKWRSHKQLTIKSQEFPLNLKIIKLPQQFQKFMPKLCELIPYSKFTNQMIDQHHKFISYKLGGIFDIAKDEFMIKFIIYPNLHCIVKMVSNSRMAEQLLNSIIYMVGQ